MQKFSDILRKERTQKRILLRNLSEATGISVGYISDLEQERRQPPTDFKLIEKLEIALGITGRKLQEAASNERQLLPPQIVSSYFQRPGLQEAFFRLSQMSDQDLSDFLNSQEKK